MTTDELDALRSEIKETEMHLTSLRKEYRERSTEALRAAIEARKEADRTVRKEMMKLGYRAPVTQYWP